MEDINNNDTKEISILPKKKRNKIFVIILIILSTILFLRFVVGDSEDSWICDKGQWVIHGNPSYPKPLNSCGQEVSLPKNKEDCLKIDGVWKKLGPDPSESCNIKAKDSGNICRDNSECEGMCQVELTKEELSKGMRGSIPTNKKYGQCSEWVVVLGCQGMMQDGKAQVICIN